MDIMIEMMYTERARGKGGSTCESKIKRRGLKLWTP